MFNCDESEIQDIYRWQSHEISQWFQNSETLTACKKLIVLVGVFNAEYTERNEKPIFIVIPNFFLSFRVLIAPSRDLLLRYLPSLTLFKSFYFRFDPFGYTMRRSKLRLFIWLCCFTSFIYRWLYWQNDKSRDMFGCCFFRDWDVLFYKCKSSQSWTYRNTDRGHHGCWKGEGGPC